MIRSIRVRRVCMSAALIALAAAATGGVGGMGGCASEPKWTPASAAAPSADAGRAETLATQAQIAEDRDRPDEAIELYRQSVAAYREFPAAWNNLGRLLMERGDGLEAATAFRVAADLSPTDPRPVYNLATLWEERGYYDDAARFYAEALERDENFLLALRGAIYVDRHARNRIDETVARRIRRALLLETDPKWRTFFEREKIRVEEDPRASAGPIAR